MVVSMRYRHKYPLRGYETKKEQDERLKNGLKTLRDEKLKKKVLGLIANYWAQDEPKPPIPFTIMATLYYRERNLFSKGPTDNRYFNELLHRLPDMLNHVLGEALLRRYAYGSETRLEDDVIERMVLVFYSEKEKIALKHFFKNIMESDFDLPDEVSDNPSDQAQVNTNSR